MDPLSALGVAGNAIQIVDFSIRFFSQVKELRDSADGEIQEISNLRNEAKRLLSQNRSIIEVLETRRSGNDLTTLEKDIFSLCTESKSVAFELLEELNKMSHGSQNATAMKALQYTVKAMWRQKSITKLKHQLLSLRDMLSSTILANLQQDILLRAQQSSHSVVTSWNDTQTLQEWIHTQKQDIENWKKRLLHAVDSSHWRVIAEGVNQRQADGPRSWDDAPVVETLKSSLLDKLAYREISDREERIPRALRKTFNWIFSDPLEIENPDQSWSSFKNWLLHGTGIYWITGKPGSGKSTLMKMVYQEPQTMSLLQSWSGSTPVVTAGFYFWNSGTELQMSQEGLLRSLLHQALSKRLKITPKLSSSSKWSAFSLSIGHKSPTLATGRSFLDQSLTWEQLTQAFRFLVEDDAESPVNYAFFIDGLDEYCGDPSKLISLMQHLASYSNVKICTSSRPWVVFEDAFKQQPNLVLQHRTSGDIALYAEQTLSANAAFDELRQYNAEHASTLIDKITCKASGVFLWVVLVVRSLLEGLEQGDKPTELQRRLEGLPEELNALFTRLLHGLKGDHFKDAAQLFRIFHAAEIKPSVLVLDFADEEDEGWIISRDVALLESREIWYRALTMKRRLNSRCKGLLEIGPLPGQVPESYIWTGPTVGSLHKNRNRSNVRDLLNPELKDSRAVKDLRIGEGHLLAAAEVDYLHRTVKDFLISPTIWCQILSASEATFNPHASLFRAYLAYLKTMPPEHLSSNTLWESMSRSMEQAKELAHKDIELHTYYLDVLNEAAIQLTTRQNIRGSTYIQQYWSSSNHHWASTLSQGQKDDNFLVFAVRCNLIEYLRAKFEEEPPTPQFASSLLKTAIYRRNAPFLRASRTEKQNLNGIDLAMVEFLIHNGADRDLYMRWNCGANRRVKNVPTAAQPHLGYPYQKMPEEESSEGEHERGLRAVRMRDWIQAMTDP